MGEKPRISSLENLILSKYLKSYLSYNVTSTAKLNLKLLKDKTIWS